MIFDFENEDCDLIYNSKLNKYMRVYTKEWISFSDSKQFTVVLTATCDNWELSSYQTDNPENIEFFQGEVKEKQKFN